MSQEATTETTLQPQRRGLMQELFPSVVSGIIVGVVGAVVVALIVNALTQGGNQDATLSAAYTAWVFFFMVGIGAFNDVIKWGFGRREPTHEEEQQLAGKGQGLWRYFRWTTDHKVVGLQGIIMIVAAVIMVAGPFGNFVVPIMIGARDMAFPRLNALSYWLLFADIPIIITTLFLGGFQTGWTGYAPLQVAQLTPGADAYCFFIIVFAISTTVAALNIITTVMVLRTRGMTWGRLPVLVWGVVLSVLLSLTAFPTFMMSQIMVVMDRVFQTSFFEAAFGGNNWVYEHLFWFFGHPEVYVIVLPSLAVAAEVSAVFARKGIFGRRMLVGSLVGISLLSVIVWGHHLYFSGSNDPLDAPFMLDTELISIPTGVFFLALVGTYWRGKIWVTVPVLFVVGVLVNFVIGGITGIYLADLPTDEILHGGMFVTAHFHFTLVGAGVFGFFAGFYYWFPKMVGKRLNPFLGQLHFWLFEIGFLGTFISLFYAGLIGEPRWQANIAPPFAVPNTIASLFAILIAASVFVAVYNVVITFRRGEPALANEWGGKTLEWTVPTPVPLENFPGELPVVTSTPYDYGEPEPAPSDVEGSLESPLLPHSQAES